MNDDSRRALFAPEKARMRPAEVAVESPCRARYESRDEAVSVDSLAYAHAFAVTIDD